MDDPVGRLAAARPGERWVVRHRLPDGRATDVTGWLDSVADGFVRLTTADGAVRVRTDTVIVSRRVPAAAGGPDVTRTSPAELEQIAVGGWMALHEPLGEWVLRAAGGFTGRANSCLAVGDPGLPIPEAAERVVAFSRSHGIRPWAQVVVGSAEEQALRGLGWFSAYVTTDVLACRLAEFLGDRLPAADVRVSEELGRDWWAAYQESRPNSADPALLRMILDGNPPRAFADVPTPEGLVGIGRGHLAAGWLGLASVWTRPEHRRRGLAGRVMVSLGHWAAHRGARWVYLQVAAENRPAVDAYGRLGFRHHHSYRYLEAPF